MSFLEPSITAWATLPPPESSQTSLNPQFPSCRLRVSPASTSDPASHSVPQFRLGLQPEPNLVSAGAPGGLPLVVSTLSHGCGIHLGLNVSWLAGCRVWHREFDGNRTVAAMTRFQFQIARRGFRSKIAFRTAPHSVEATSRAKHGDHRRKRPLLVGEKFLPTWSRIYRSPSYCPRQSRVSVVRMACGGRSKSLLGFGCRSPGIPSRELLKFR